MHLVYSGVSHFRCCSEETCYKEVRKLIAMLPAWAQENNNIHRKYKYNEKINSQINHLIPKSRKKVYDAKKVIHELCDENMRI